MATREIERESGQAHRAAGYCCVFLAGCYVTAVILLVGYLIAAMIR